MTPYEQILDTLKRAEKSKDEITRATGIPYGPLGHALEVLTLEGKVEKCGLRYKLRRKSNVLPELRKTYWL